MYKYTTGYYYFSNADKNLGGAYALKASSLGFPYFLIGLSFAI